MGKMLDNVRAFWNGLGDKFSDPGKLAQLSVADLENGIRKAKDAAAPIVGRPVAMESILKSLKKQDGEFTVKIKSLLAAGTEAGQAAARKYIERQVIVRKEIIETEAEYEDAVTAAAEWKAKIQQLENELYSRRNKADKLQATYEAAKAETRLGKAMQSVDSISGSDEFSRLEARVNKEKAKAAGYSAMSGLDDKVNDAKIVADVEAEALLAEYMNGNI